MKDSIYSKLQEQVKDFTFNEDVAAVFDDMISRSVPLYADVQQATGLLAGLFARPGTSVYDLGCSTGTTIIEIGKRVPPSVKLVGIDNSAPMLHQCRKKLAEAAPALQVELQESDLAEADVSGASVVVLNYTLQFLPPAKREELLVRLYGQMLPGSVLVLSEKIKHQHPAVQEMMTSLYVGFKRAHGYSELEISQKRDALENVLVPFSLEQNIAMLQRAGFAFVEVFLKSLSFCSMAAIKAG